MHVWIYGIVKGVFFRQNIKDMAENLNIKGLVRNKEEGVEAIFEGDSENIKKMLQFCKSGPKFAKVDKVESKEETFTGEFKDFRILHF